MFSGIQAHTIALSIGEYFAKIETPVWACAVLPDHIHLVTGRPSVKIESVVIQLKGNATEKLVSAGIHPFQSEVDAKGRRPKCFSRGEWKVYLHRADVPFAIRYVEGNPEKEGKRHQRWSFVVPYDG
jgi:REP element-mobilizing transposase RayT